MKFKTWLLFALITTTGALPINAAPKKAATKPQASQRPQFDYCLVTYYQQVVTVSKSDGNETMDTGKTVGSAALTLSTLGRSGWRVIGFEAVETYKLVWTLERRR